MSSFICSPLHFNSIEKSLSDLFSFNREIYFPYSLKDAYPVLYNARQHTPDQIGATVKSLTDTLRRLNVLCVSLQYAHHAAPGTLDSEIKTETDNLLINRKERKHLTNHGLYNALRCLSYQIELSHLKELRELEQDEKNAMLFLKEMIHALAMHLVSKMPEDVSCTWSL